MRYFVGILVFLFILSCKSDDDTPVIINPNVNSSGLQGKWSMIAVSGGFIGTDHTFAKDIVVWEFDDTSKTVKVTNNNTDNSLEDGLSTGTYNFSIRNAQDIQELIINDNSIGNFQLGNNTFSVDEQFRDGFRYVFER